MTRMGNGYLSRIYDNKTFKRVEKKSNTQDISQFSGRLGKGDTFIIGDNGKERFYLTVYNDGSIEIWVKKQARSTLTEETVCKLTDYEVNCINQLFTEGLSGLITAEMSTRNLIA